MTIESIASTPLGQVVGRVAHQLGLYGVIGPAATGPGRKRARGPT